MGYNPSMKTLNDGTFSPLLKENLKSRRFASAQSDGFWFLSLF